jgi:hypothetical protein
MKQRIQIRRHSIPPRYNVLQLRVQHVPSVRENQSEKPLLLG